MNKYLNIPSVQAGTNTGNPQNVIIPRLIKGVILTSKTKSYTQLQMASFLTALQADTLKTGTDKIYPIFEFKEISDKSADVKKNTSGYSFNEVVQEGKYDWIFSLAGSSGLYNSQQLRRLNGGSYRAFFIDDNNNIIGTQDSAGNFKGAELEFVYVYPWKVNEGSKPAVFQIEFALNNSAELNDNIAVYDASFDVKTSILGCLNIQLTSLALAAGKATIGLATEGDKVNLYSLFADAFAVATNWVATNLTTGVITTITTVAKNSAQQGWDLSLTAGTYQIALAAPSVLSAAAIPIGGAPDNGYDGIPITVIIPSV